MTKRHRFLSTWVENFGACRRSPCWAGVLAFALGGFFSGCATIPPPRAALNLLTPRPSASTDRTRYNLAVYDNVWNWVYSDYYDERFNGVDWPAARLRHRDAAARAQTEAALYTAINALLGELKDQHTHAAMAEEFASTFAHRNAVLGLRTLPTGRPPDSRRRVTEVLAGTPADSAGVKPGWILLSCNGRPPTEVIGPGKLRDGEVVRCVFQTNATGERTLEIRAKLMVVPPYRSVRQVADQIYLLRFDNFDMPSARWVREQLRTHRDAKGIIFDLRGNPGGHVFALGSILGDVFERRVATGQLVHRGKAAHWDRLISQRGGARYAGPLVVMVSQYTTSAAEIFAQLIQDYGRGKLVGEKTAGVMLTSIFWPLPGGGKLQMSVYDYRSPKGRRLEGNGVQPDVTVAYPEVPTEENDVGVAAAVSLLKGNK